MVSPGLANAFWSTGMPGSCAFWFRICGGSIAVIDLDQDAPEIGDLRDPSDPDDEGNPQPFHEFGWSTHDVQVDDHGIAWVSGRGASTPCCSPRARSPSSRTIVDERAGACLACT